MYCEIKIKFIYLCRNLVFYKGMKYNYLNLFLKMLTLRRKKKRCLLIGNSPILVFYGSPNSKYSAHTGFHYFF